MDKLQLKRFNTQLVVETMITKHQLDDEFAVKILKSILEDYVLKGGVHEHTLTLKLRRDIPREIVVKLYDNINMDDLVKIRAKT